MGFFGSPIKALVTGWANSRGLPIRFLFCSRHSCSGDPPSEAVCPGNQDLLCLLWKESHKWEVLTLSSVEAAVEPHFIHCFVWIVVFQTNLSIPFPWCSSQLCTSLGSAVAKLSLQVSSCQPYPISWLHFLFLCMQHFCLNWSRVVVLVINGKWG